MNTERLKASSQLLRPISGDNRNCADWPTHERHILRLNQARATLHQSSGDKGVQRAEHCSSIR
jgi:hypothetical protein